jgi:dipeptidyl aminopeptidase/acylaminoacyl peptidase
MRGLPLGRQLLCACLLALATASVQAEARVPVEHFFDNPPFGDAVLSPDGRLLAVVMGSPGKRDALAVVETANGTIHPTARFGDTDIGRIRWVNNKRLIFDTTDKQVGMRDLAHGPGLYAADYDGANFRQLALRYNGDTDHGGLAAQGKQMLPWHTFLMDQPGAQDSDAVYVISPAYTGRDASHVDLLQLNTLSGRSRVLERAGATLHWVLDQRGEPRLSVSAEKDSMAVHYRNPDGSWRKLSSFNMYSGSHGFSPLAFGQDGVLYVEAAAGNDKQAIHTLDLATGTINSKALITTPGYDFDGELIFGRGKLMGFRLRTDAESTVWRDAGMKAVQAEVDKLLGSTVNLIAVPARAETPWVLVTAYSDVSPRTLMLYNTETKAMARIGSAHPAIKPAQMGRQEALRYRARDGLDIPALLTLPAGGKRTGLPMVVLVHGGPWLRGASWGWEAEVQFLASRGYAVLQPEFRGSTGFGNKHFTAGWMQWGLAMQNDIADGAKWAIGQGIADPKRVCIAGASYGGYAALMGLVNDPALFRCGISWVGVTDINLLFDGHWSINDDLSERYRHYGMPAMVGDQQNDAAQLKATSPLQQAARVTQPLLLAYGGADRRVPLYHGKQFYQAVKPTNPDVEWVVYPDEGHGWALTKNRFDFWTRVEKFLDRHIGKP